MSIDYKRCMLGTIQRLPQAQPRSALSDVVHRLKYPRRHSWQRLALCVCDQSVSTSKNITGCCALRRVASPFLTDCSWRPSFYTLFLEICPLASTFTSDLKLSSSTGHGEVGTHQVCKRTSSLRHTRRASVAEHVRSTFKPFQMHKRKIAEQNSGCLLAHAQLVRLLTCGRGWHHH